MKSNSMMSNPLFIIVMLLLALIIILSIFRSVSPALTLGFGVNAHIGDLRGSFELETFSNANEAVFVMYYAEWCGHCKRAKPEFQKLLDNYKGNIKIMAVNAESQEHSELVKSQKINGFPTIRYYPNGISENYKEYDGGRTYSDFVQYLGQVEGVTDVAPDQAAPVDHFSNMRRDYS
jgi:thiol-disulfide isomerase/thioredoxin